SGAPGGRPRLVLAVRELPLPARSGSPLRTHRLATGMAHAFAITPVTFEHHPASSHFPMTRADLAAGLPGIDVVTVPGLRTPKRVEQLLSVPRRRSWQWGRYRTRAMVRGLREVVARTGAALVHYDDVGVALCGPVP